MPKFDELRGLVMEMRCPMTSPLDCHQLGVTICNLMQRCVQGTASRVWGWHIDALRSST